MNLSKEASENGKNYSVYKHTNLINGKVYIGITSNAPEVRWGSQGEGYQLQPIFYNAIKKYGWENFDHQIIYTELDRATALEKEQELIALYKSNCCRYRDPSYGYNATDGGEGARGYGKPVNQYDLRGHFIKTWNSIKEASDSLAISRFSISQCCIKTTQRGGNFMWCYYEESPNEDPITSYYTRTGITDPESLLIEQAERKKTREEKAAIIQYSLTGDKIQEYPSIKVAAAQTNTSESAICATCQGKNKSSGGYVWRYKIPRPEIALPKYYYIAQYKDGTCIGKYSTTLEAARVTGVSSSHISEVCRPNGHRHTAGGYSWKKVWFTIGEYNNECLADD